MPRIAIVEDEAPEREMLKHYVSTYFSSRGESVETLCYSDGDEFVDEYPSPDIILMDIEMKRMDGLSAARSIRRFDDHVMLLFVTNMVNFALEGYAVDATDFIIKPLSYDSFCVRMDRVMQKLDTLRDKYLEVRTGRESCFVNIRQLLYAETSNKKTVLYSSDGSTLTVTNPLYTLEEKLSDSGFFRCHSAFLVNMERITTVTSTDAFINGTAIPISKHRRKEFMSALANFRGRML